jgi:Tat protein secretion system quality control protein TatD with DNase activity
MGMETMMVTGTSLEESKEAIAMAERYGESFLFVGRQQQPLQQPLLIPPIAPLRHCWYLIIM